MRTCILYLLSLPNSPSHRFLHHHLYPPSLLSIRFILLLSFFYYQWISYFLLYSLLDNFRPKKLFYRLISIFPLTIVNQPFLPFFIEIHRNVRVIWISRSCGWKCLQIIKINVDSDTDFILFHVRQSVFQDFFAIGLVQKRRIRTHSFNWFYAI